MKLVYIAGPYRNDDRWEEEQNVRRAEAIAIEIAKLGAMPICPHSNTRPYFCSVRDNQFWYDGTMALLRKCDALVTVDGWTKSIGAKREMDEARKMGIPVFVNEMDTLKNWIDGGSA